MRYLLRLFSANANMAIIIAITSPAITYVPRGDMLPEVDPGVAVGAGVGVGTGVGLGAGVGVG